MFRMTIAAALDISKKTLLVRPTPGRLGGNWSAKSIFRGVNIVSRRLKGGAGIKFGSGVEESEMSGKNCIEEAEPYCRKIQ